ncbi:MAG TPA: sensory rhodopsin transducer [Pseudolabrys sp.]
MSKGIGRTTWAIAEGYIPPASTGKTRELTSHETVCILNASDAEAKVEITVYFADRDPSGPYVFTVGAQRTRHLRFNEFKDPQPIPVNTDFSSVIVSNTPIVVQHTRLDSRQAELALLSTMAFPVDSA